MILKNKKMYSVCAGLAVCALLTGCTETAGSVTPTPAVGVDITVPYATITPERTQEAEVTSAPISISVNGSVTLNDVTFLDAAIPTEEETDAGDYSQLAQGDGGEAVSRLQTRLKQLNYYSGEVTGIFDDETREAVCLFELTYGNMQTGIASAVMQSKLYMAGAPIYGSEAYEEALASWYTNLQRGDAGPAVKSLQTRLMELGYSITELTGTYDDMTANAVSEFYESYGFPSNDVATIAMQRELYSDNAYNCDTLGQGGITDLYSISEGSMGSLVINLQTKLVQLGYLTTEITGMYDVPTVQAVKLFQEAMGLPQSGEANSELQQLLMSDFAPTRRELEYFPETGDYEDLFEGDYGEKVERLQARLIELGYANGDPNGVYEEVTVRVVNLFREKLGMSRNGAASAVLQAALFAEYAPAYGEVILPKPTIDPYGAAGSEDTALYSELKIGRTGQDVLALEKRLKELGYFESEADSRYDGETVKAVKAFQAAMCVAQTGIATANLQYHLYTDYAPPKGVTLWDTQPLLTELHIGDNSNDVLNIQRALWQLEFLNREDISDSYGILNEATMTAVQDCEKALGYAGVTDSVSVEFQSFLLSRYGQNIVK